MECPSLRQASVNATAGTPRIAGIGLGQGFYTDAWRKFLVGSRKCGCFVQVVLLAALMRL